MGNNPNDWANLAGKQPGTAIGASAGIRKADAALIEGQQQRFVNRATANQQLADAVTFYDLVRNNAPSPMLRERATFGWALRPGNRRQA